MKKVKNVTKAEGSINQWESKLSNTKLILPGNISMEQIAKASEYYRTQKETEASLNDEYSSVILDFIIRRNLKIRYYWSKSTSLDNIYGKYDDYKLASSMTPIESKVFQKLIPENYKSYIDALGLGSIVKIGNTISNYSDKTKCNYWKINPEFLGENRDKKYQSYHISSARLKKQLYKRKIKRISQYREEAKSHNRLFLFESIQKAFMAMDLDSIKESFKNVNRTTVETDSKNILSIPKYIDFVLKPEQNWSESIYRIKDKYGSLQSIFTIMPQEIWKFIPLNNSFENIVTKFPNFKMMLLAQLLVNPDEIKKIIVDKNLDFVFDWAKKLDKSDINEFVNQSMAGTIKEYISEKLNLTDVMKVEKMIFKIINIDSKTNFKELEISSINELFPAFVKFCTNINSQNEMCVAEILEFLESKIILDIISPEMHKSGFGDFLTIKDCLIYNEKFKEDAEVIIKDSFEELGLDAPVFKHNKLR